MSVEISPDVLVGAVAVKSPWAARALENLKIDYSWGGRRTLREASETAGIPMEELLASLGEALERKSIFRDWMTAPLDSLTRHIQDQHHSYIRNEGQRIYALMARVVARHAERHPELNEVRDLYWSVIQNLAGHITQQEQLLFPLVKKLGQAVPSCKTLAEPVQRMFAEHDQVGEWLLQIRTLTSDYAPPPDACTSYTALLQALLAWERDVQQHLHLENNILFPRLLALIGGEGGSGTSSS